MKNTTKQSFKGKGATIILTVVALVCVLILCPLECYFLPEYIEFFIYCVLPVVCFLLFFTKFHQFKKANIILAIFLLVWAILSHIVCSVLKQHEIYEGYLKGYNEYLYKYYSLKTVAVLALIIIIIGLFGVFKSKKLYAILASVALASCVIPLVLIAYMCFLRGFNSYAASVILHLLFLCLVDIAILIYLTNSEKNIKKLTNTMKKQKEITPENELKALKEKIDQNMISQEEYDAQRAEIISKL